MCNNSIMLISYELFQTANMQFLSDVLTAAASRNSYEYLDKIYVIMEYYSVVSFHRVKIYKII